MQANRKKKKILLEKLLFPLLWKFLLPFPKSYERLKKKRWKEIVKRCENNPYVTVKVTVCVLFFLSSFCVCICISFPIKKKNRQHQDISEKIQNYSIKYHTTMWIHHITSVKAIDNLQYLALFLTIVIALKIV